MEAISGHCETSRRSDASSNCVRPLLQARASLASCLLLSLLTSALASSDARYRGSLAPYSGFRHNYGSRHYTRG